jgi:hypothetical protein
MVTVIAILKGKNKQFQKSGVTVHPPKVCEGVRRVTIFGTPL